MVASDEAVGVDLGESSFDQRDSSGHLAGEAVEWLRYRLQLYRDLGNGLVVADGSSSLPNLMRKFWIKSYIVCVLGSS